MNDKLDKGGNAEEALRDYFLSQGFYVVRGAKVIFRDFHVTDVDLFLYSRSSSFTRERANVDIKKRKTPQAFERILWTKGLMSALGFERCFVATSDHRAEITEFGARHGVMVLDGTFIGRLPAPKAANGGPRLSEEEFLTSLDVASVGKLGGDWKGAYEDSKARVLYDVDFDAANAVLEDVQHLITTMAASPQDAAARRICYVVLSHFLLVVDFLSSSLPGLDIEARRKYFEDGFRFGTRGKKHAQDIVALAANLATSVGGRYKNFGTAMQQEILAQSASLPVGILAEFFAKSGTLKNTLDAAIQFEHAGFARTPTPSGALPSELQAIIGVLCDYFQIDRKGVLGMT
jgi:hypothetical protein